MVGKAAGNEGEGREERDHQASEQTHEPGPLRKSAKTGPAETNAESNNHCSQDRKADGSNKIEVGTCVHLHQTSLEVITPNYQKHDITQLLLRQPMLENQMLPELLADFSTNSVVEVREVTPPLAHSITRYNS